MPSEHKWTVVAIVRVDVERAAEIHEMDGPERLQRLDEIFPALPPDRINGPVETVRGPICSDCRVHWRDVHAVPDKPWPCPGAKPATFGGPLVPPDRRLTRQERRRRQREAVRTTS